MAVRIAINGFGRIGRITMRNALSNPKVEIVAINDRMDAKLMAFLFTHDSVHGRYPGEVSFTQDALTVDGKQIHALRITDDLLNLPWADLKIDVVLECTGIFHDREKAGKHIQAGAKKVIISAPGKNIDGTFALGINLESYDPLKHHVISNASCTTNCLAPLAKVLFDEFGIERGLMTTVHSYHHGPESLGHRTQGLSACEGRSNEHDSDQHGRGVGGRVGHSGARRQA